MSRDTFDGLHEGTAASLDEACERFGLNREVEKRPLSYLGKDNEQLMSPWHEQVVDVETDNPLGVVGNRYVVVPFRIAFSPAEPLIEAGAKVIGGGAPHWGNVGYLRLQAEGEIQVGSNHKILNQFLYRSSHDGTGKIELRSTPFFTANGVAMTVDATRPLAFKHTLNVNTRIERAKKTFKRVQENWEEFGNGIRKMMVYPMSDEDAKAFIKDITPSENESTRIENIRENIYVLFKLTGAARHLPECRGTLFGLIQAVGEWADFHRTTRKSKKRDEEAALLDARLVNDAAKKKAKCWAMALWMVNDKRLQGAGGGR